MDTFFPTRNWYIYTIWVRVLYSGGHKKLEDVLSITFAFEAFITEGVLEIHDKVVVDTRAVMSAWAMRQSLVAQLFTRMYRRFCDVRTHVFIEKNWSLHINQYTVHMETLLVHFIHSTAELLRCNRFASIQKSVMVYTGYRIPNCHRNIFWMIL